MSETPNIIARAQGTRDRIDAKRVPNRSRRRLKTVCIALTALGASAVVQAQVSVEPGALELERERGVPAVPGDLTEDDTTEAAQQRQGEWVVAPLPSRSPLLGWQLTLPALYLYRPSFATPEDSVWITGAAAFYAESDSYGGGLFHRMSLGGDKWRITGGLFSATLKYDFFGIGDGNTDFSVPLDQETSLVFAEALRRLGGRWYLGLRALVSGTDVGLDVPSEVLPPNLEPEDLRRDYDLATLAPRLQLDTRDAQFYPRSGTLFEGTASIGRDAWGSDADYENYKLEYNHYRSLSDSGVLAVRAMTEYVGGDAPFFLFPAFGAGADLRGYNTGSYRDRFKFAAQAEYRWRFAERWGAVGFAGIGTVDEDFLGWGRSLGSIGAGVRWVIAPRNDMSLRFDIARGRDDTEFYLGIGEAF